MRDMTSQAELHAAQYQHVDGSFELTFGGSLLVMALCFLGITYIPGGSTFIGNWVVPYLPLAAFVASAYLLDGLMKRLRMRITVARSGYMEMRKAEPARPPVRRIIRIGIPVLALLVLALLSLNRGKTPTPNLTAFSWLMALFAGFVFTGLWAIAAWKLKLPRFHLLALITLAITIVIFLNRFDNYFNMAILFGVMGAGLCMIGGFILWRYWRSPAPPENVSREEP